MYFSSSNSLPVIGSVTKSSHLDNTDFYDMVASTPEASAILSAFGEVAYDSYIDYHLDSHGPPSGATGKGHSLDVPTIRYSLIKKIQALIPRLRRTSRIRVPGLVWRDKFRQPRPVLLVLPRAVLGEFVIRLWISYYAQIKTFPTSIFGINHQGRSGISDGSDQEKLSAP
ncbi:hypothetical protein AJ80_09016 [Polytolypa hystricis UAMH7299]|uniref:Uncharacterized protein n=1 Tax=Polytolypa hystricis (strain UAMH7299) TaxID=1447883 RepID=A0A2B7WWY9_POLH7|nr:hypothetical protein AJ80_09016 [Polytolypa hystricis UAMH7299]